VSIIDWSAPVIGAPQARPAGGVRFMAPEVRSSDPVIVQAVPAP
jgi:hypothetical protein